MEKPVLVYYMVNTREVQLGQYIVLEKVQLCQYMLGQYMIGL